MIVHTNMNLMICMVSADPRLYRYYITLSVAEQIATLQHPENYVAMTNSRLRNG